MSRDYNSETLEMTKAGVPNITKIAVAKNGARGDIAHTIHTVVDKRDGLMFQDQEALAQALVINHLPAKEGEAITNSNGNLAMHGKSFINNHYKRGMLKIPYHDASFTPELIQNAQVQYAKEVGEITKNELKYWASQVEDVKIRNSAVTLATAPSMLGLVDREVRDRPFASLDFVMGKDARGILTPSIRVPVTDSYWFTADEASFTRNANITDESASFRFKSITGNETQFSQARQADLYSDKIKTTIEVDKLTEVSTKIYVAVSAIETNELRQAIAARGSNFYNNTTLSWSQELSITKRDHDMAIQLELLNGNSLYNGILKRVGEVPNDVSATPEFSAINYTGEQYIIPTGDVGFMAFLQAIYNTSVAKGWSGSLVIAQCVPDTIAIDKACINALLTSFIEINDAFRAAYGDRIWAMDYINSKMQGTYRLTKLEFLQTALAKMGLDIVETRQYSSIANDRNGGQAVARAGLFGSNWKSVLSIYSRTGRAFDKQTSLILGGHSNTSIIGNRQWVDSAGFRTSAQMVDVMVPFAADSAYESNRLVLGLRA